MDCEEKILQDLEKEMINTCSDLKIYEACLSWEHDPDAKFASIMSVIRKRIDYEIQKHDILKDDEDAESRSCKESDTNYEKIPTFQYKDLPKKVQFKYLGKKYKVTDEDMIWHMLTQCMNDQCEWYAEVEEDK